jgi:hypothetical protein
MPRKKTHPTILELRRIGRKLEKLGAQAMDDPWKAQVALAAIENMRVSLDWLKTALEREQP